MAEYLGLFSDSRADKKRGCECRCRCCNRCSESKYPEKGTKVYTVWLGYDCPIQSTPWDGSDLYKRCYDRGLVFLSRESAEEANKAALEALRKLPR